MMEELEKLFRTYQNKENEYSKQAEYNHGDIVNAYELKGLRRSINSSYKKFTKAFRDVHGDDINILLDWQNQRT
jgi:hypothetical protein